MNRIDTLWATSLFDAALTAGMSLLGEKPHASTHAAQSPASPSQADAIIQAAQRSAFDRLLGPFQPTNKVEQIRP